MKGYVSAMEKKNWLSVLKKFFSVSSHSNRDKKRRRWMFGRKFIKPHVAISAPRLFLESVISELELEHRKHAYYMDVSTAEPSSVLVRSPKVSEDEPREFYAINTECDTPPPTPQCEMEIQEFAALKIQKAFRGYLVLDGKPYNRKCDVYSFGVCLWEIYCCDLP